ncbi:MAG: hypothetical protein AYK18_13550 [Theionarchaea archaeon DG-70]|nr:MAG: hypothetical protein AYK18_13550 [Theionarchaea archaeon DG-70]
MSRYNLEKAINKTEILTVALFIVIEGFFLSLPISSDTDIQYLLSALSQALAALFALVFTIILIVSQMASIYSHRLMDSVFNKKTKAYMTFFAFAVIIPFIALRTSYLRTAFVQVSGTLAIACILYLIPFILLTKENLKIESLTLNLSKKSVEKIKSNLKGGYEEHYLSKEEKEIFFEEIKIIDNIACSAWNRKDYDTFQTVVEKMLWILSESRNWPTIEEIRTRIEDIGRIVAKDARATNIVLDSMRDVFPHISENERGYPFKELLRDYRKYSVYVAQEGLLVSSNQSLINYYQIGKEVLKRKNDNHAKSLFEDFYKIFSKADHDRFPDKGRVFLNIAAIGTESAKLGFQDATKIFLAIMSDKFFWPFLSSFRTLDIIEEEAKKRQWKEIINFCQEIRENIKKD